MERHIAKPIQRRVLAQALSEVQGRGATTFASRAPTETGAVQDTDSVEASAAAPVADITLAVLREALDAQVDELSREGVAEVIQSLVDGVDKAMAALTGSAENGDATGLRRSAHSLKSNTAMVGAAWLSDQFETIEVRAKSGAVDGLAPQVVMLAAAYRRLVGHLRELHAHYVDDEAERSGGPA
jgi:HPt (histidine-containing phosphotransfer) domain-containing protein